MIGVLLESYWLYGLVGGIAGAAIANSSGAFREGAVPALFVCTVVTIVAIIAALALNMFAHALAAAIVAIAMRVEMLFMCLAGTAICADRRTLIR